MHIHHEIIRRNFTILQLHKVNGFDHWHQRAEIVYILDGSCEIKVGNTKKICNVGDMAVIHSGEIHAITNLANCKMYVCTFDPKLLYNFRSDPKYISNFISADALEQAGIMGEIHASFDKMFAELKSEDAWYDVIIRACILQVYSLLLRHFERKTNDKPQTLAKLREFQKALKFIEENYDKNITLSDIAGIINYNTSYVSSLFVSYTGQNFKTYLDSFRIHKAIKLLNGTDCTITDISAQCGFANIRTFNNVFRKVTGKTPSELRTTNI